LQSKGRGEADVFKKAFLFLSEAFVKPGWSLKRKIKKRIDKSSKNLENEGIKKGTNGVIELLY
jgi:hypothetical protein